MADFNELFVDKSPQSPVTVRREGRFTCTVVSMLPFPLLEDKPHMLPSCFAVPAAKGDKLGLLYVGEGYHYIPNPLIDEGKPGSSIKQTTMPDEMARSIVDDYASAQVSLAENAGPGIFWVVGRLTQKEIVEGYPELLVKYADMQRNWFRNLCALADADWNKNHNMLAVSDLQRVAAKALGITKDWVDFHVEEHIKCPMCQIPVVPEAVVCSGCRFILKPEKYNKEQFANV
jgi:hypothetical protein